MLENSNSPFGMRPVAGGPAGEQTPVSEYTMPATTAKFGIGEPVTKSAGNNVAPAGAGASVKLLGSVVGISYVDANGTFREVQVWPGNVTGATDIVVKVADDVNQKFEIQFDGEFELNDLGKNARLTASSTNDTAKRSSVALANGSVATTATLPLKILGKITGQRNGAVVGNYTVAVVKINNHINAPGEAGV